MMRTYSSTECYTLPHVILTSDTDWDPRFIASVEAKDDAWFDNVSDSSQIESHGYFYMHGDYVEQNIL